MKKILTLLMSSILLGFAASAQEALFQAQNIVSPKTPKPQNPKTP